MAIPCSRKQSISECPIWYHFLGYLIPVRGWAFNYIVFLFLQMDIFSHNLLYVMNWNVWWYSSQYIDGLDA